MGGVLAGPMQEQMRKQQEFMVANGQLVMERQIEMQNFMRERMMAAQIARAKELLNWTGSFAALLSTGLIGAALGTKKKQFLAPLVPIGFAIGYQVDLAYGTKIERITSMAEDILIEQPEKFRLPLGPITFEDVEKRRLENRKVNDGKL